MNNIATALSAIIASNISSYPQREPMLPAAERLKRYILFSLKKIDQEISVQQHSILSRYFENAVRRIYKIIDHPDTRAIEDTDELCDRALAISTWLNSLA